METIAVIISTMGILYCILDLYCYFIEPKCPMCGSHSTEFSSFTQDAKEIFCCKNCGQKFVADKKK